MMITEQLIGYLPGMSSWVDCALVGALAGSGYYMFRASRAIRALRKAQEETPVQIQALIDNLEAVRTAVSNTLAEVNVSITAMAESVGKADVLKDDFDHLTGRLQRHLVKAQETIDEVAQVTAAADRIADRIVETTGLAKEFLAPKPAPAAPEDSVIPDDEESSASTERPEAGEVPAEGTQAPAAVEPPAAPVDEARPVLAAARSPRVSYASHSGRGRRRA